MRVRVCSGRQAFCVAVSCLGVLLPATAGWAIAGDLDPSFSKDGRVRTSFIGSHANADDVAVRSDGKIVAVGSVFDGVKDRFALVRYNSNGSLDRTFSRDGRVVTTLTAGDDDAFGVALLPNGKVVAAGRGGGRGGRFALARYRSTGVLDTTFNNDGKALTNFSDAEDAAYGVAVQSDRRIVAAGEAGDSGGSFALARYTRDGSLDKTFDGDGRLVTDFTSDSDVAFSVLIQPDGRIVAAGDAEGDFALARYNSDGTLDTTFGGSGMVMTDFSPETGGWDTAYGVAIQLDGKIVAAGAAGGDEDVDPGDFALARYNPDGALDGTFGTGGKVRLSVGVGDYIVDVALLLDGKIVVVGISEYSFIVARFNPDGTVDAGFGNGGLVDTGFPPDGGAVPTAVAIQPNGRIVAAGYTQPYDAEEKFAIARYLAA
jgi:uncharacterized delta-60 repeat protein